MLAFSLLLIANAFSKTSPKKGNNTPRLLGRRRKMNFIIAIGHAPPSVTGYYSNSDPAIGAGVTLAHA